MPKTEQEWKTCLSPEQYKILREKGTEAAFTGKYYKNKKKGNEPDNPKISRIGGY